VHEGFFENPKRLLRNAQKEKMECRLQSASYLQKRTEVRAPPKTVIKQSLKVLK
jgi:hypothetical protein